MSNNDALKAIKAAGWWQGSIVGSAQLAAACPVPEGADYWVMASQTCNLYNADFEAIPVAEMVAAQRIDAINPAFVKGDHPRTLHVRGVLDGEVAYFSINILNRFWIPRQLLSQLVPDFHLFDEMPDSSADWRKNQWLNLFSGWLGRSYTRVALPDEFNDALNFSKIRDVLNTKLTKQGDKLYGIYFSIAPDSEEPWEGITGLMPPPYSLAIKLVVDAGEDPEALKKALMEQLFEHKVSDNTVDKGEQITRSALAAKHGIRIIKQGIEAQTTEQISLDELRYYIRYSMVDHLSNAAMAVPE